MYWYRYVYEYSFFFFFCRQCNNWCVGGFSGRSSRQSTRGSEWLPGVFQTLKCNKFNDCFFFFFFYPYLVVWLKSRNISKYLFYPTCSCWLRRRFISELFFFFFIPFKRTNIRVRKKSYGTWPTDEILQ